MIKPASILLILTAAFIFLSSCTNLHKQEREMNGVTSLRPHSGSIPVLVNKYSSLPPGYKPDDLVFPNVPFLFTEKIEKRMLRKEAASALELLFQEAEKDGIFLAGVSAYRSYEAQQAIFNSYVQAQGIEKAKTFSASPGTSEHETGLAVDISDKDGKCPAVDCFGQTTEAGWLEKHAHTYGFIIRYPKGKEDITGYKYEPWHLRYVGPRIAAEIKERNIALEEYLKAEPVITKSDSK
ncbi:D-alanyl-D-alanine carboxypeptidase family protein [Peribacillus sp. SCS-155]|uniref:M15 family metallopeptidase n=1 Tax=Peribacillus sedimenti TaxID=3115297 RepID=UPI003906AD07